MARRGGKALRAGLQATFEMAATLAFCVPEALDRNATCGYRKLSSQDSSQHSINFFGASVMRSANGSRCAAAASYVADDGRLAPRLN